MSIFYISLALSIIFTLLVSSLRMIARFPKTWKYLHYFKRFNVIPKLVIINQIYGYRFFGVYPGKHIILFYIIVCGCHLLALLGFIFKIIVIKEGFIIMAPFLIFLISFILCINTIFRSFTNCCVIIHDTKLFSFLHSQKFFSEIQKIPYWDKYVKELDERMEVRYKMEKDLLKNNKKT